MVTTDKQDYLTLDITAIVHSWLDNPSLHFGLAIQQTSGASFQISSTEGTGSRDASLDISLTGPQGPQGIAGATGATGPEGPAGPGTLRLVDSQSVEVGRVIAFNPAEMSVLINSGGIWFSLNAVVRNGFAETNPGQITQSGQIFY